MTQIAQNAGSAAIGPKIAKRPVLTVALRAASVWSARRRSRIALSHLSSAQLRDIGLDRMIADTEAQRPFWHP